jgi:hypothetical protein
MIGILCTTAIATTAILSAPGDGCWTVQHGGCCSVNSAANQYFGIRCQGGNYCGVDIQHEDLYSGAAETIAGYGLSQLIETILPDPAACEFARPFCDLTSPDGCGHYSETISFECETEFSVPLFNGTCGS